MIRFKNFVKMKKIDKLIHCVTLNKLLIKIIKNGRY